MQTRLNNKRNLLGYISNLYNLHVCTPGLQAWFDPDSRSLSLSFFTAHSVGFMLRFASLKLTTWLIAKTKAIGFCYMFPGLHLSKRQ